MNRNIILGLIAALVILLIASAMLRRPDTEVKWVDVRRGSLQVWTTYDGTIQSRSVRGISSQIGGSATIVELIPEGTFVQNGTPLVKLDTSSLERDAIRTQRELSLARAEYESLTKARMPLEKREMEIRLLQARSDLQDADDALSDLRELIAEKLIPEQDAVQQEKRNAILRATHDNIEQQLALTLDFLHPSALDRATAQLTSAEGEWAMAQRQMEQSVIVAPSDGIVVYQPISISGEFRPARVGDTVFKNQIFITLPDMSNLIVQIDIPEYELTLAQQGRPVVVTPLAFPDLRLAGVIESVGSMAQARPDRPGRQKFFQVTVKLTETRSMLRTGMSARVQVLSHNETDVVLIPRAAVLWENNTSYCLVRKNGRDQREPIVLGIAGAHEVAVLDGLTAGQRIILP